MRKYLKGILALLTLCLCFGLGGLKANARDVSGKITKSAYVDTTQKALILHFEKFSKKNSYTYTIVMSGGKTIGQGKAAPDQMYPLKGYYKNNTAYKIVITSKEGNSLSVYYYTGNAVDNYHVTQVKKDVRQVWRVKNSKVYDGFSAQIAKKGYIGAKKKQNVPTSVNDVVQKFSDMDNGDYQTRLICYKRAHGRIYYGQGFIKPLTYVQLPSSITGLAATPNTKRVTLTWNGVSGAAYYKVYKAISPAGKYQLVDKVKTTNTTITDLTGGRRYYFKVASVAVFNNKAVDGNASGAAGAKVPLVAGKVQDAQAALDKNDTIYLKWDKTKHAYGYHVYYKKHAEKNYKKLGGTFNTRASLKKLTEDTTYDLIVYAISKAGGKKYRSNLHSNVVSINPKRDVPKVLASSVKTIKYIGSYKEIYTSKKYSTRTKEAFVNTKGYKSKTKYLIWVSHYTQQVSIFKGSKGKWKMFRTFTVATGRARSRSPRGVFKIGRKEKGWYYNSTKILYISHYYGENSFHTRPLYYSGGVATATLGRPASHGCVRCPTDDAKYIYYNIPSNTTVVSW